MTNRHLVIGLGEVGQAIHDLLHEYHIVQGIDLKDEQEPKVWDYLHVCFQWSDEFFKIVEAYKQRYLNQSGLVVIHSTVPIGTSRSLDSIHSPIRGRHPDLLKSLRVFVKYFGGLQASLAAEEFSMCGVKCCVVSNSDNTEALKLWDTLQYGWNIILEKTIHNWCVEHELNFDLIYRQANESYNQGYSALGYPWFTKYVLTHQPGAIGGHCVLQNAEILAESADIAQKFLLMEQDLR